MGMTQRLKRYAVEIDQQKKRGKVYADGQASLSARVKLALAVGKYAQKIASVFQQSRTLAAKAREIREAKSPTPSEYREIRLDVLGVGPMAKSEELAGLINRVNSEASGLYRLELSIDGGAE